MYSVSSIFDNSEDQYQTKTRNSEFSLLNFEMMSAMQTIAISLLLELETECSGFFIIHPEIRSQIICIKYCVLFLVSSICLRKIKQKL